jgi:hypothetical protein
MEIDEKDLAVARWKTYEKTDSAWWNKENKNPLPLKEYGAENYVPYTGEDTYYEYEEEFDRRYEEEDSYGEGFQFGLELKDENYETVISFEEERLNKLKDLCLKIKLLEEEKDKNINRILLLETQKTKEMIMYLTGTIDGCTAAIRITEEGETQ